MKSIPRTFAGKRSRGVVQRIFVLTIVDVQVDLGQPIDAIGFQSTGFGQWSPFFILGAYFLSGFDVQSLYPADLIILEDLSYGKLNCVLSATYYLDRGDKICRGASLSNHAQKGVFPIRARRGRRSLDDRGLHTYRVGHGRLTGGGGDGRHGRDAKAFVVHVSETVIHGRSLGRNHDSSRRHVAGTSSGLEATAVLVLGVLEALGESNQVVDFFLIFDFLGFFRGLLGGGSFLHVERGGSNRGAVLGLDRIIIIAVKGTATFTVGVEFLSVEREPGDLAALKHREQVLKELGKIQVLHEPLIGLDLADGVQHHNGSKQKLHNRRLFHGFGFYNVQQR